MRPPINAHKVPSFCVDHNHGPQKTFHLIVVTFFSVWQSLDASQRNEFGLFFFQKPDQTTHSKFLLRVLNNKNEFLYQTILIR